jgi:copper oxidase (laccase) domain-containing protein
MKRLTARILDTAGIAHGFFGREGGVSGGLYESLNCGPGSSDDPAAVSENRRLVAAALTPNTHARLVSLSQVHSPIVHTLPAWEERPEGDAMVTATPGLALGWLADARRCCWPIQSKVIGAAHPVEGGRWAAY